MVGVEYVATYMASGISPAFKADIGILVPSGGTAKPKSW